MPHVQPQVYRVLSAEEQRLPDDPVLKVLESHPTPKGKQQGLRQLLAFLEQKWHSLPKTAQQERLDLIGVIDRAANELRGLQYAAKPGTAAAQIWDEKQWMSARPGTPKSLDWLGKGRVREVTEADVMRDRTTEGIKPAKSVRSRQQAVPQPKAHRPQRPPEPDWTRRSDLQQRRARFQRRRRFRKRIGAGLGVGGLVAGAAGLAATQYAVRPPKPLKAASGQFMHPKPPTWKVLQNQVPLSLPTRPKFDPTARKRAVATGFPLAKNASWQEHVNRVAAAEKKLAAKMARRQRIKQRTKEAGLVTGAATLAGLPLLSKDSDMQYAVAQRKIRQTKPQPTAPPLANNRPRIPWHERDPIARWVKKPFKAARRYPVVAGVAASGVAGSLAAEYLKQRKKEQRLQQRHHFNHQIWPAASRNRAGYPLDEEALNRRVTRETLHAADRIQANRNRSLGERVRTASGRSTIGRAAARAGQRAGSLAGRIGRAGLTAAGAGLLTAAAIDLIERLNRSNPRLRLPTIRVDQELLQGYGDEGCMRAVCYDTSERFQALSTSELYALKGQFDRLASKTRSAARRVPLSLLLGFWLSEVMGRGVSGALQVDKPQRPLPLHLLTHEPRPQARPHEQQQFATHARTQIIGSHPPRMRSPRERLAERRRSAKTTPAKHYAIPAIVAGGLRLGARIAPALLRSGAGRKVAKTVTAGAKKFKPATSRISRRAGAANLKVWPKSMQATATGAGTKVPLGKRAGRTGKRVLAGTASVAGQTALMTGMFVGADKLMQPKASTPLPGMYYPES